MTGRILKEGVVRRGLPNLSDDEVIALVWPDGLPETDRLRLSALPAADRERAMNRLRALKDESVPVAERVGMSGLTRNAFHELRRRWAASQEPRLEVIVPYLFRPVRQKVSYPPIEAAARIAAAAMRDASVEAIVAHLKETFGDAPGLSTLRRIVNSARREMVAPRGTILAGERRYVLDYSSSDVLMSRAGALQFADLALVFEQSLGLVLGGAAGAHASALHLAETAWSRAKEALKDGKSQLPSVGDDPLTLAAAVMPPETNELEEWQAFQMKLIGDVGESGLIEHGSQRFGSFMARSIGPRLGTIHLKPRRADVGFNRTPSAKRIEVAKPRTPEEVDALLLSQIAVHNDIVLAKLAKNSGDGPDGD